MQEGWRSIKDPDSMTTQITFTLTDRLFASVWNPTTIIKEVVYHVIKVLADRVLERYADEIIAGIKPSEVRDLVVGRAAFTLMQDVDRRYRDAEKLVRG